jgi:hypothetical protein
MIQKWFKKIKAFYRASAENRTQIHLFLGFIVIPIIGMTVLYVLVYRYLWP